MTIRSHDQFNTTVYGDDDRYRGIRGDRRVVLLHRDDLAERGLAEGDSVDLTSHFAGETRTAARLPRRRLRHSRAAARPPTSRRRTRSCPLGAFAEGSLTPAYKSVVISVERGAAEGAGA